MSLVFPEFSIEKITAGPKDHFLATYYGINSFDSGEKYLLILETSVRDHLPTKDEPAAIGLLDIKTRKFTPLAETRAWNFQQGCMAHWLGTASDSTVIYNDFRDGRFVSVIRNVFDKNERIISKPVSTVSPDGKYAVSINFARIRAIRADYGYDGNGDDALINDPAPSDDGLFLIDLETGSSKLIISIADLKKFTGVPETADPEEPMWINHTVFNKNGKCVFFLFRVKSSKKWMCTSSLMINSDGTDLRNVFPDSWTWEGSHYDWLSNDKLMVTANYQGKMWSHVLCTDGKDDYRLLGNGLLNFDGHGTFSPDGKWMSTDTYPDRTGMQTLMLMDMSSEAVLSLGRFHHPPEFKEHWRCDLHARWSPTSEMIAFNSINDSTRQVYLIRFA